MGTWAEMPGSGGAGEDIPKAIQELGARGHIHQVHFRNVSSPIPDIIETYPDNGYLDMHTIMQALRDIEFEGVVVPDHVPINRDGQRETGEAFILGYIRALLDATK